MTSCMASWADLSDDEVYRYSLGRRWATGPLCGWVMLNPSTADGQTDDPTIRRCIGFAQAWGYGGILVRNVYALRATDPRELARHRDPVGPRNRAYLLAMADDADGVVCAWGSRVDKDLAWRTRSTLAQAGATLYCLGRTKAGQPRHPLYVPATTERERYTG